jgi:PilZ domain
LQYHPRMTQERRQYARQPGPFDGSWNATSGQHACRITHLSPSGCFVDSPYAPPPGTPLTVTVLLGDTRFTVPAQVVYLDPEQGFGARFLSSDQTRALAYAMGLTEPGLGEEVED